jgi:YD repeat-containing protein
MTKLKLIITSTFMFVALLSLSLTAHATTYKYDDLGRVIEVTYNSGQKVTYTYDAGGNILTVNNVPATVDTLSVIPQSCTLKAGEADTLAVTATFTGNIVKDVTKSAVYTSADPQIATVSPAGVVKGISAGQTTIKVSYGDKAVEVEINVGSAIIYGDVNGDGEVNSTDYAWVRKYILGVVDEFPIGYEGLTAADVNGDKNINSTDYSWVRRKILGIIEKFPVEE